MARMTVRFQVPGRLAVFESDVGNAALIVWGWAREYGGQRVSHLSSPTRDAISSIKYAVEHYAINNGLKLAPVPDVFRGWIETDPVFQVYAEGLLNWLVHRGEFEIEITPEYELAS